MEDRSRIASQWSGNARTTNRARRESIAGHSRVHAYSLMAGMEEKLFQQRRKLGDHLVDDGGWGLRGKRRHPVSQVEDAGLVA